jgi:hypothetical protein
MTDKLYHVETQVHEFEGCKDVPFAWFKWEPAEHRSYADLIEGYDPDKHHYAEGYVDEQLFTEDEAKQLKTYVDQTNGHEGVTTIRDVQLPVPNNLMSVGAVAVGGGCDFLMIFERSDYPLPFKAAAYYRLDVLEEWKAAKAAPTNVLPDLEDLDLPF